MRIAYVIEKMSGIGGMERILADKINYLVEHTVHEVVLILLWHDDSPLAYPINPKVRVVRLNVPQVPKLISPKLFALYRFNKVIERIAPDVTVYVWTMAAFLAAFTSWKGKSVLESHLALSAMRRRYFIKKAASKVDVTICLTEGDAKEFRDVARKVFVIPNYTSISTAEYPDYMHRSVMFVGRNNPQKNIPRLKKLWLVVKKRHSDWILTMHHDTKDIVKAYLEGSILVMTSKFEGLPMVLIEAQTCGLPIVAFDCPYGPKDIIADGKTGYLIPYDDDQMFIDKLSRLMDDEKLRIKMGTEAKRASMRYQPAQVMSMWLKLFTSLKN